MLRRWRPVRKAWRDLWCLLVRQPGKHASYHEVARSLSTFQDKLSLLCGFGKGNRARWTSFGIFQLKFKAKQDAVRCPRQQSLLRQRRYPCGEELRWGRGWFCQRLYDAKLRWVWAAQVPMIPPYFNHQTPRRCSSLEQVPQVLGIWLSRAQFWLPCLVTV